MTRLRYVKGPEELKQARDAAPPSLESQVRSIRAVYETDAAVAAALVPRPLELARPEVCVTFSQVAMRLSPEFTLEIGSTLFGVRARYDGEEGIYLLTMPMTSEQAVLSGRETYGEPKKIAQIDFARDADRVSAKVTRMGISYLEAHGRLGEALGPRRLDEVAFCFKALPSCEPERALDADPLLVRLEWRHEHRQVHRLDAGELLLRESPFDPVADVPLRRLVCLEHEEGTTESSGRVLRAIPGEWLLPFLHQRYDDPTAQGIEVP